MRLIDADALIAEMHNVILEDGEDRRIFYDVIERQPIIDPVKRGKWIKKEVLVPLPWDYEPMDYDKYDEESHSEWVEKYFCSVCDFESGDFEGGNFCPNCGADMRGGSDAQVH